ncbi:formate hydrogenlyase maturation HycH family protein [Shewanella eurypsychrophilus]|uniref:Formate hydrogenlyase maturation HycH family protein n=1 Tax=Shewanella eurypsychrophilus TaxID=2593656 RepID=A0ABX6VF10_9GAMM|nr:MULTISPECIES: formate hydrogenlyase maturation HycH family protein [Shewanella]QPG60405.2 formate hydrogenlyase maturation HycH family protein [Shewanella eurypsychrophilus]
MSMKSVSVESMSTKSVPDKPKIPDMATMSDKVMFYSLNRKFVDEKDDVPEEAKEIIYYGLAIGHHLGIVDCLKVVVSCSRQAYQEWLEYLPEGSVARQKMEGFFTFGEITIFPEHIHMLANAFQAVIAEQTPEFKTLSESFITALGALHREPDVYIMVRGR